MWSEYSLEVADAVARNGSLSAAAQSCIAFLLRSAIPCVSWKKGWRCRCLNDVTVMELTAAGRGFSKKGALLSKNADHPPAMSADSERLARSVSYRSG